MYDLPYLPKPNSVEVWLSGETADPRLTASAFIIPMFDDGSIALAVNRFRGLEIAGGHIEEGESFSVAVSRECKEETGIIVANVIPIGFLKMETRGTIPQGYRYPHPVSYQQFFVGMVSAITEPLVDDECSGFVRIYRADDPRIDKPHMKAFCERALSL